MKVQKIFLPGDTWLYIKLYMNENLSDTVIRLLFHKLYSYKKNISCFFIRYNDPDFHLRFRFLIPSKTIYSDFFIIITDYINKLYEDKYIGKVQVESYERELNRYCILPIDLTEQHFCLESEFIYKYLCYNEKNENRLFKHELAFFIINKYIEFTNIDLSSIIYYFRQLSLAYKNEFGFNEFNSKSINSMYRKNKELVEKSIEGSNLKIDSDISNLLNDYISSSSLYFKKIALKQNDINFSEHLFSVIHMFINRLFSTKNRLHELIIYDFFLRYYQSLKART